jgi:hypothetical protein
MATRTLAACAALVGIIAFTPLAKAQHAPHAASDWYILSDATSTCISAKALAVKEHAPFVASPHEAEMALRHEGVFKETQVVRDADGKVAQVFVLMDSGKGLEYFIDRPTCDKALQASIADGSRTKPGELE